MVLHAHCRDRYAKYINGNQGAIKGNFTTLMVTGLKTSLFHSLTCSSCGFYSRAALQGAASYTTGGVVTCPPKSGSLEVLHIPTRKRAHTHTHTHTHTRTDSSFVGIDLRCIDFELCACLYSWACFVVAHRGYCLQGNTGHKWQGLCVNRDTCHLGVIKYHPACHMCKCTTAASIQGFPLQGKDPLYTSYEMCFRAVANSCVSFRLTIVLCCSMLLASKLLRLSTHMTNPRARCIFTCPSNPCTDPSRYGQADANGIVEK